MGKNNGMFPKGWSRVASKFDGLCAYTGKANGNYALCNVPKNSHSWRTASQSGTFMCARVAWQQPRRKVSKKVKKKVKKAAKKVASLQKRLYKKAMAKKTNKKAKKKVKKKKDFRAWLGQKNGIPARIYTFRKVTATNTKGRYSDIMVRDCKKYDMKPICDHPSYCKNDKKAIYMGQHGHVEYPGHRKNVGYFPDGFNKIMNKFDGTCAYTGAHGGGKALCNIPKNSHSWKTASQARTFMCAKVETENGAPFHVALGAKNGVPARKYIFQRVAASEDNGAYSRVMIRDCKRHGMKPICDHPSYCKNDKKVIYLGQSGHVEYPGHRKNNGMFPKGWSKHARKFDRLCAYTGKAHGNKALCNMPKNSHSWRKPSEAQSFMCAKIVSKEATVLYNPDGTLVSPVVSDAVSESED